MTSELRIKIPKFGDTLKYIICWGFYNCGVENAEETPGILRVAGGFEPRSLVFALFNSDTVC